MYCAVFGGGAPTQRLLKDQQPELLYSRNSQQGSLCCTRRSTWPALRPSGDLLKDQQQATLLKEFTARILKKVLVHTFSVAIVMDFTTLYAKSFW